MMTKKTMVPFAALLLTFALGLAPSDTKNEVWSIDQSDSAGKNYGGTIYIWDSKDLERVNKEAVAERVDLGGAASALCLAQTGANPVRPHMLTMNKASTHAIVSFVASGHVLFMDAHTRQPISCIRTPVASIIGQIGALSGRMSACWQGTPLGVVQVARSILAA